MKYLFPVLIVFLFVLGCTQIRKTADSLLKPTAREIYARKFDNNNEDLIRWEKAFQDSRNDSLTVTLPYVEEGKFSSRFAYSYDVALEKGERLHVVVETDSIEVFVDIFHKNGNDLKPLKSSESGKSEITMEIEKSQVYKIIIQPEISAEQQFGIVIYTQPAYLFPVAGADNRNIQSFWGAERGGGSRTHEGVDIFAKRGTPVIAGVEGRIGFTGERGLGGKQVWLSDGLFGNSLYYAHLDSIAVSTGNKVERGDTLGFVGNTGNAEHSPPHLHFGIYEGMGGATDPLAFIRMKEIPKVRNGFNKVSAKVSRNGSELRLGPSTQFTQIASLSKNDSVRVLGRSDKWYHVAVKDSLKGFMHGSLLQF